MPIIVFNASFHNDITVLSVQTGDPNNLNNPGPVIPPANNHSVGPTVIERRMSVCFPDFTPPNIGFDIQLFYFNNGIKKTMTINVAVRNGGTVVIDDAMIGAVNNQITPPAPAIQYILVQPVQQTTTQPAVNPGAPTGGAQPQQTQQTGNPRQRGNQNANIT